MAGSRRFEAVWSALNGEVPFVLYQGAMPKLNAGIAKTGNAGRLVGELRGDFEELLPRPVGRRGIEPGCGEEVGVVVDDHGVPLGWEQDPDPAEFACLKKAWVDIGKIIIEFGRDRKFVYGRKRPCATPGRRISKPMFTMSGAAPRSESAASASRNASWLGAGYITNSTSTQGYCASKRLNAAA